MNTCAVGEPRLVSIFLLFFLVLGSAYASPAHLDVVSTLEFSRENSLEGILNGSPFTLDPVKYQGASRVSSTTIANTKYYFKSEPRFLFDSIIASQVLNRAFPKDAQRFPLISLGVDPRDLTLFSISEELKGFKTVVNLYQSAPSKPQGPFYESNIEKLKDLGNLYVGLFLVGGGDVHPGNVAYSESNGFFGDVDLDVAFKQHLPFNTPNLEKERERFMKSDLALREFDCNDPCPNFLYLTDSRFSHKEYTGYKNDCWYSVWV